jgi:hypothetical protein
VDPEVVVDVRHEVVQRGRLPGGPPEEDEGVLEQLLELRVVEVALDVVLHRSDEGEPPRRPHHVEVEEVPQPRPVLVDEPLHADLVALAGGREVVVERVGRPRFVGLEGVPDRVEVTRDVRAVAVLPEDAVVRVQVREVVVVVRRPVEPGEVPLEDVGHQVPRRSRVEAEAVGLDTSGHPAEVVVPFDERHVGPPVRQERRRREAAEPPTDDRHRLPVQVRCHG